MEHIFSVGNEVYLLLCDCPKIDCPACSGTGKIVLADNVTYDCPRCAHTDEDGFYYDTPGKTFAEYSEYHIEKYTISERKNQRRHGTEADIQYIYTLQNDEYGKRCVNENEIFASEVDAKQAMDEAIKNAI